MLYLAGRCFPEAIEAERSVVTTQISELGRAQRRVGVARQSPSWSRFCGSRRLGRMRVPSLGCSEEFCVGARPARTRVVRQGRTRLFRADELRCALYDIAEYAVWVGLSDRWTISI